MLSRVSPDAAEAANRLAQPERMGVLFKALAVTPPDVVPPGFDAP
jgi:SAM-dependent MidA family methyltransferase